jgi:hypothetical protein
MILASGLNLLFCPAVKAEENSGLTSGGLWEGKFAPGGHPGHSYETGTSSNRPSYSVATLWESKYISEGRDNLDDGGIFVAEAMMEWKGFVGGVWTALGDSQSYQEVNAFIEYCLVVGPLDLCAGYTRLEFLEDSTDDNEFAAGVALNLIPFLVPAVDYVYSTESDGGFLELSLSSEIAFFNARFVLEPYALQAFDFGYATDDHDGPNNFQVGIGASFGLTEHIDAVGSVSHSWAQEDIDREGLGDKSWVTIGLAASF